MEGKKWINNFREETCRKRSVERREHNIKMDLKAISYENLYGDFNFGSYLLRRTVHFMKLKLNIDFLEQKTGTHKLVHDIKYRSHQDKQLLFEAYSDVRSNSLRRWYINIIIEFLDIIHRPLFLLLFKTTFRRLDSVSVFRQKPTHLGPIDRASPYHRTPAPTQHRIYKPNATWTISGS
jgi:hypothetical protein